MTRKEVHEAVVKQADLHEVLAKGSGLDVVVVGLRDAAKEVHWVGEAQIIVESSEDVFLSTQNFRLREPIVGDVTEVGNVRRKDLFILGGNEHSGNTNKLKAIKLNDFS